MYVQYRYTVHICVCILRPQHHKRQGRQGHMYMYIIALGKQNTLYMYVLYNVKAVGQSVAKFRRSKA